MSEKPKEKEGEQKKEDSNENPQQTQHEKELEEEIATIKEGAEHTIKDLKQKLKDVTPAEKPKEDTKEKNTNPAIGKEDVVNLLKDMLAQEDASRVEQLKSKTFEKFIIAHNEFNESNDTGGFRLAAFKSKLARMNTQGLVTENDFMSVFADAYRLLGNEDTQPKTPGETSPPTPTIPGNPNIVADGKLTAEDKKSMEANGMTEEQYKEKMEKHGDMINSLRMIGSMNG